MEIIELLKSLPITLRIISINILALIAHFIVTRIRSFSKWLLSLITSEVKSKTENPIKQYPKIVTISTILISAITFTIYFLAFGLILQEFNISLTAYLASASVIGLAIGFGAQGFVQDLVIGLTLIFSDTLDIGDVVDISGQVGKVDSIGLRFTTLINLQGQFIYIPNRNISAIGQFQEVVFGLMLTYKSQLVLMKKLLLIILNQLVWGCINNINQLFYPNQKFLKLKK